MTPEFGPMDSSRPSDPFNYVRPTNQLVFLLQKDMDFPPYPMELSASIDEKTWYSRMDQLCVALHKTWSWMEKGLFIFALVMSIALPWPFIALISQYVGPSNSDSSDALGNGTASTDSSTSNTATGPSANLPSSTITSGAATATRMAIKYMMHVKRQDGSNSDNSAWTDTNSTGDGSDGGWIGDGYWQDNFSNEARWAAIMTILGLLVVVWLPWCIYSYKNHRRISTLLDSWNIADDKLGYMRALLWSLDKAPAFNNAKLLTIALPPGYQQMPTIFHMNAYPPAYGFSAHNPAFNRSSLPGYGDETGSAFVIIAANDQGIDNKGDWSYAYGSEISDAKINELPPDADESLETGSVKGRSRLSKQGLLSRRGSRDSLASIRSDSLRTIREADDDEHDAEDFKDTPETPTHVELSSAGVQESAKDTDNADDDRADEPVGTSRRSSLARPAHTPRRSSYREA